LKRIVNIIFPSRFGWGLLISHHYSLSFYMNLRAFSYLIFMGFILDSCTNKEQVLESNSLTQIPALNQEVLPVESFLERKKIIRLEFCEECIIGEINKILTDQTGIYVLDKTISNSIKKFDWKGKFLFSISQTGAGLGNFILPFDFDLVDSSVVVLDVNQRKMLFYNNEDGVFEKESRFGDFQAMTFASLGDDFFAFHLDGRNFGPSKHYLGLISDGKLSADSAKFIFEYGNTDYLSLEQDFSRSNGNLLYSKSMNDTIYEVDKRGFKAKYFLDFGEKAISEEIKKSDMLIAREKIMTDWPFFSWGRVFENSDHLFFLWSGNQGERKLSVFDKKAKKTQLLQSDKFFPLNVFQVDEDLVWAFITPEEYMENNIEGLSKEYENPVLISYQIR